MKRILHLLLTTIALMGVVSSCQKDDVESNGEGGMTGYGSNLTIYLPADFSDDIHLESIICEIRTSTPELRYITATHTLVDGKSAFVLDEPLPVGSNILRAVRYTGVSTSTRTNDYSEVTMGCTIKVTSEENTIVPDIYNEKYKLFGEGTEKKPFVIASAKNFAAINDMDRTDYFFKQIDSIDFFRYYGHETGFEGICPDYNKPFKGYFKGGGGSSLKITNLAVRRYTEEQTKLYTLGDVNPAGLFCCVSGAVIENVLIDNPHIVGDEAVGGVVGMVLGASGSTTATTIINGCRVMRSVENDNMILGSTCVGGVVGVVEYAGNALISNCSIDKSVLLKARSAAYGGNYLGGIIGSSGLSAVLSIVDCENNAILEGDGITNIGGLVGCAQTIRMINCINNANITLKNGDDTTVGVGGLIGGSTDAFISGSTNYGDISGTRGVGGLIGSAIYDTGAETATYGNVNIFSSHNHGDIMGTINVGGVAGDGQVSLTNTLNTGRVEIGSVSGDSYDESAIGGLVGFASMLVSRDSHNLGIVNGKNSGGLSGVAEYFFVYGCSNMGEITGNNVGGLVGKTSEYGIINFSHNFSDVSGSGNVGGLVGALGQHNSTANKLAALGEDAEEAGIMAAVKFGAEFVFGVGASSLVGKACKLAGEILGHAPILIEAYEISEAIYEIVELSEELAERCEEVAENGEEAEEGEEGEVSTEDENGDGGVADIKTKIETAMKDGIAANDNTLTTKLNAAIAQVEYKGAMELSKDIIKPIFNNTRNFCQAVDTDSYDGSTVKTTLTRNTFDGLYDLSEKQSTARKVEEAITIIEKCVVAAFSIAAGVGVEKAAKKGVKLIAKAGIWAGGTVGIVTAGAAATIAIDAQSEFTEDDDNLIIVDQCSNFGEVFGGNGLVGAIGDRLRFMNVISAGPASGAAVADTADGKNLYDSCIICIGDYNATPYSDKDAVGTDISKCFMYGDSSTLNGSYSKEEMSDRNIYASSDNDADWDWGIWSMEDGDDIPLFSDNKYLSFY